MGKVYRRVFTTYPEDIAAHKNEMLIILFTLQITNYRYSQSNDGKNVLPPVRTVVVILYKYFESCLELWQLKTG